MNELGRTWTNMDEPNSGGRGWGGRTWTNMDEPYLKGWGIKITNMDEHGRTRKNMDEHVRTISEAGGREGLTNMDELG